MLGICFAHAEDTCWPICGDGLRVDRAFSSTLAADKLEAQHLSKTREALNSTRGRPRDPGRIHATYPPSLGNSMPLTWPLTGGPFTRKLIFRRKKVVQELIMYTQNKSLRLCS